MTNRTAGDDLVDQAWGEVGIPTGTAANQLGLDKYHRMNSGSRSSNLDKSNSSSHSPHLVTSRRSVTPAKASVEDILANLAGMAIGIFLGVAVAKSPESGQYWPWGIGIVAAILSAKLLRGPLRFLMSLLKWALIVAVVATIAVLIWGNP